MNGHYKLRSYNLPIALASKTNQWLLTKKILKKIKNIFNPFVLSKYDCFRK